MAAITAPTWTAGLELKEAAVANLALYRIAADPIKDTLEDTPSSRQCRVVFPAVRDELLRDYPFNFAMRRANLAEDTSFSPKGEWTYAYKVEPYPAAYATIGTTALSAVLTGFTGLAVNALRGLKVSGAGIPTGAYVVSNDATTVTLNAAATASASITITMALAMLKLLEVDGNNANSFEIIGEGPSRRLLCNLVTTTGTPNLLEIKYVEQVADPDSWDSLFKDALVLRLGSKLAVPLTKRADLAQFLQGEFAAILTLAKMASSKERVVEEGESSWTAR